MKRYGALLRGINISGKNKVVMAELKKEIESLMFENVKTYLNSGNVIFSSRENIEKITKQIEEMLKKNYDFKIPVFVLEQEKLKDILEHAPIWWGSDDMKAFVVQIPLFCKRLGGSFTRMNSCHVWRLVGALMKKEH